MIEFPKANCGECGKEVSTLEIFPKHRCLECHARAHENDTPAQLLEQIVDGFGGRNSK